MQPDRKVLCMTYSHMFYLQYHIEQTPSITNAMVPKTPPGTPFHSLVTWDIDDGINILVEEI